MTTRIYNDNGPETAEATADPRVANARAEVQSAYRGLAAAGFASRDIVAFLQDALVSAGCRDRAMRNRSRG